MLIHFHTYLSVLEGRILEIDALFRANKIEVLRVDSTEDFRASKDGLTVFHWWFSCIFPPSN